MDPQLLARIQAMIGGGGGQSPTTPFTQPPGTTLNSMGAPSPAPAAMPGQQNSPQPNAPGGMNMGSIGKGIGQVANALSPQPAQMSQQQTPNLQPHQMNPQMLAMLQQQQQRPGSPGGGGPFGDSQGYGYG